MRSRSLRTCRCHPAIRPFPTGSWFRFRWLRRSCLRLSPPCLQRFLRSCLRSSHRRSLRSLHPRSLPSLHPRSRRSCLRSCLRSYLRMSHLTCRSARWASGSGSGSCCGRDRCDTRLRWPRLPQMLKEKSNESYDPPASTREQEPCAARRAWCSLSRPAAAGFSRALPHGSRWRTEPAMLALDGVSYPGSVLARGVGGCRKSMRIARVAVAGQRTALSTARLEKIPR
jgi:hypothetical protein